ncbi:DUF4349 domain-containing protein [Sphingomonas sp. H39-1-10]|uniref:DUF4349 domain-containing protein n=1 Tax=Sphingomonas pollutisoli TaxID=3030829 RepID=UPI0023B928A5|nr:DUF4349 domain-containing protein [Sphingomonas pollutisoli]MDF0487207.1 DUF4349 domain-containing protein [Sphingomonas pollutisoli]
MRLVWLVIASATLAGCDKAGHTAKMNTFDVAAPAADTSGAPKIAYSYSVTYRIDAGSIAGVQAKQVALCTALGGARCRIIKTSVGTDTIEGGTNGQTSLLVAAGIANGFNAKLDAVVVAAGGTVQSRSTNAEDITKQTIDTDARVRAKQALADRLLALIQHGSGNVGDLVAAEKAYSDTQEEVDAARSLQAELRQRVAMSQIDVDYTSSDPRSIFAPVRRSARTAGESFGNSLAALLTFVIVALPWVALLALLLWLKRRLGWRWSLRKRITRRRTDAAPPSD